jgi:BirA family biotin operon repressor/biotin-[acetyl-CoA-carboxylase] ligase
MIIKHSIFDIPVINNVILYEETDSTNLRAKDFGRGGSVDGTLVIADMQTAGRGRIGRRFSSPSGDGIYMSLLLKPSVEANLVSQITLIAGLAIADALSDIEGISPLIKWPNDIIIGGKKAAGILTELSDDNVIIGIGINVNNKSFSGELADTAVSLYQVCGRELTREDIIYGIWEHFSEYYRKFLELGSLKFMLDKYNSFLASYDKEVFIIPHSQSEASSNPYNMDTSGLTPYHCMGIDIHGDLICRHPKGELTLVNSGEVSLRSNDGSYV